MNFDGMENDLKTNWTQLKHKLQKHWGKITANDVQQIRGKSDELIKVLRNRYGYGKAQAEIEIKHWLEEQASQQDKRTIQ